MSHCTDKRYEEMLHAFEMGMLNDDDYNEFRLHLMDCQHCFERAQKFEATSELMRTDDDVRKVPDRVLAAESDSKVGDPVKQITPTVRKRFWPRIVPVPVVAAAIFVLLVVKPWNFEFWKPNDLQAEENRLAVIDFENLADPADAQGLGKIVAGLLIADLSESSFMQVVSSQRLNDILTRLGSEESDILDRDVATRVATEAGAHWILVGTVLQEEPRLVLAAQLVDVASGTVVASQRATGDDGENVFSLVDKLTVQVKDDLTLPMAAQEELDRQVADVTTHSSLAYRHYLEGVVAYQRLFNAEALQSFNKALEIDSTFAMVYYYLSLIEDARLIDKAVENSGKARRKDGFYIRSRKSQLEGDIDQAIEELRQSLKYDPFDKEAYYRIGLCYTSRLEFEAAIENFRMAADLDPLYKLAYNQMAYTYDWMGDLENSIQSIDMYISLAPGEPNPYDSRGDIYNRNGKLPEAIDSYVQALELKPDFWPSLYKLGTNNLFTGETAAAERCFHELAACDGNFWRSNGLAALAYVPLQQGRFDDAIGILDEGMAATASDPDGRDNPLLHLLKAIAYEEKGDLDQALLELEESIRVNRLRQPDNKVYNQHLLVRTLALLGDIERAQEVSDEFGKHIELARDTIRFAFAEGSIELARGNLALAIERFEVAAEDTVIPYTPANCLLADTYFEAGRWSEGIAEAEKLSLDFTDNKLHYSSWVVRTHYLLGKAYEQTGQTELAIEQYQVFLDLWKDADQGIAEVADARERLVRLRSES